MRILHLVHQYPPEYVGGTELHTQELAKAQAKIGHEVAVFTRVAGDGNVLERRRDDKVQVYAAVHGRPSATERFLATWGDRTIESQFEQAYGEFRPDVIHVQHMMGLPKAIFDHVRAAKVPVFLTLLDFWWICANAQLLTNYNQTICAGPDRWLNCARCAAARSGSIAGWAAFPLLPPLLGWRSHILSKVMAQADALLAPCPFVRDWYVEHGAPLDRTIVVPLGIDTPPLAADSPPMRGSSEALRVLYVGGLTWQKGLHVLLEAARGVSGPLEVHIAGDLDATDDYGRQLHSLADHRVRFLGRLDRPAVWSALRSAHLIAVPSLWYETYSLLTHEAFAVQRPVFASDLGALADAVQHETDGMLLPPGNVEAWRLALQRAVDEPQLLAQLGANTSPPATVIHVAEQTLSIYTRSTPQTVGG